MCAANLFSASIAPSVEVEWYLDFERAAIGWNVGAVGFKTLPLLSMVPSACGAMVMIAEV